MTVCPVRSSWKPPNLPNFNLNCQKTDFCEFSVFSVFWPSGHKIDMAIFSHGKSYLPSLEISYLGSSMGVVTKILKGSSQRFFMVFPWFVHGFSWFFHVFSLFFMVFSWFFQRTGFQRTGNPSIFIVGHHINGFPSMNINGFPSMNSLMVHQ